jgi:polyphosphate kinase 2 (PPK2 family)
VTVRVHEELLEKQNLPATKHSLEHVIRERFDDINAFESYLRRQGYVILKFFLHLSKDEQKKRLLDRIDEKDKNWKFNSGDIKERALWNDYQAAYAECLGATSTKHNPWYAIPADDKKNARLMMSRIILDHLDELTLAHPELPPDKQRELKSIRRALVKES